MKVITTTAGTAAVQTSFDEMLPRRGIRQRDLIAFISQKYDFNVSPAIPSGIPPQPVLMFQSGGLAHEDGNIPIHQLIVFPDGFAVTAADTDLAGIVAADLISHLDSDLSYRFSDASQERLYASALVVDFDIKFLERLGAINTFSDILNEAARRPGPPYSLRRLALSQAVSTELPVFPSVVQVVPPEFVIEPRISSVSADRSRYFCGAPVRTPDHVALLERIERTVIG